MSDKAPVGFRAGAVIIAAGCLLVFSVVSFTASLQTSPSFDEPLHLYAGYSYLAWGDFRVNPEHPPLVKVLAALSFMGPHVNSGDITAAERDKVGKHKDYGWELAARFIAANRDNHSLFRHPTIVVIALAAMLGGVLFLWARDIYGLPAAFIATALYCLDPNIIAHSSIVQTDIPFTLFFFAGTYAFWHALTRPSWRRVVWVSLCFALSAVTKFSFLILLPIWAALGILHVVSRRPDAHRSNSSETSHGTGRNVALLLMMLISAIVLAYIAIWAVYGFRFTAAAHDGEAVVIDSRVFENNGLWYLGVLNSKYAIVPEAWLYGLVETLRSFDRTSYLLGEVSHHGFWLYFPVAFAVKTPLPTLILFAIGLLATLFRRPVRRAELFLIVPAVVFFCVAVGARLNIGLRHILPIYPFLFVWLGGLAGSIWNDRGRIGRWGMLILGSWLVFSTLAIHPRHLTFFNELAGGPTNGHKFLVDSNLDWGQDLKGLKAWMDRYEIGRIRLAYFGTMDPGFYGIDAVPASGSLSFLWRPQPDAPVSPYIAISATYLAGLYLREPNTYASFRDRTPVASIGHSILVFRNEP
jgi:hypothetical protein